MSLINIPETYIPTEDEMSFLDLILSDECNRYPFDRFSLHIEKVREVQRKLRHLNAVFRNEENPAAPF